MTADIVPITITSGREAREDVWNNTRTPTWFVPKIDLVGEVMSALEDKPQRLEIASQIGADAEVLMAELLNFKVRLTLSGNSKFEAGGVGVEGHRDGAHDDLLLAVAMLTWWIARRKEDRRLRRGPSPLAGYRG
jgi:hypothetical protein